MKETGSSPATDRIAAIVVNYGTAGLAVQAVESLLAHDHGGRQVTVHLVDNASPGRDAQKLRDAHASGGWGERVRLWLETENHGFGRGNNLVLKALAASDDRPEKVFLLNPDARLENEVVDFLATALDADAGAAAAGASILRPDLRPVTAAFRFPGLRSEVARMVSLGMLDRLLRHALVPLPADHPAGMVDWVSGASVMFRFGAIEDVGFFDPGFFLYYEEVDLMRRLYDKGWHVLYMPHARVIHQEGAATKQFAGSADRQRDPDYLYYSRRRYFTRARGRLGALAIALAAWGAAAVNILHRGLRGRAPTVPLRFFRDHWRLVLRPLLSPGAPGRHG